MRLHRYERAFTLIELLVVLLIMSIFFGLSFAEFRDFQRRQRIESVTRSILQDMQQAKSDAFVGKKPTAAEGCTESFLGYRFDLVNLGGGGRGYEIFALCGADFDDNNPQKISEKVVTLPDGIRVTTPGGSAYVDFFALAEGASWQGSGSTKNFTVSDSISTDFELVVVVTSGGSVYAQD